jgi:hypothetical protein
MSGEIFREKRVKQRVAECGQWAGGWLSGDATMPVRYS